MPNLNTLQYAQILQTALDQKAIQTMTTGWMDANAGQVKYTGGNEVKIPTIATQGLANYGRADQSGFVKGGVTLSYNTYTMTQDRGRLFMLDRHDIDESNFIATSTQVMGTFQEENVVPEIDAYRISKLASLATSGMTVDGYTPATGTIVEKIKTGIKNIRKQGYNGPLVCHISYDAQMVLELEMGNKIQNTTFASGGFNTTCPSIDGVPLIPTADTAMVTAITLYDGKSPSQEAGGFVKGSSAKDINFIIMPTKVPIAVTKQDNMRIFSPDVNQSADAWQMDYRRYHDLWVLENKKKLIFLNTK